MIPVMGWRMDDAHEQAERKRQRKWFASLPLQERLRLRLWQASGLGMLATFTALVLTLAGR